MGMARAEGQQTIGQEEYEFQLQKHSIGKQINALARNIAILLMGPEPLQGATALNVGDIPETDGQFFCGAQCQSISTPRFFVDVHFHVQFDCSCAGWFALVDLQTS